MSIPILMKETSMKRKPYAAFKPGFDLRQHIAIGETTTVGKGENAIRQTVAEFIGTGNFAAAWTQRQRYEIDAGRDEEPVLYAPLYNAIQDANLPKTIEIQTLGPAGVVFEEVFEGGEVKFMTVGAGEKTVTQRHFAVGLEYDKDLFKFNQLWRLAPIERQVGVAYNALMNHLHFSPILTATYAAANQTAASAVGSTLADKWVSTLQDAITNSSSDTSNPRRGPYVLLINPADVFRLEAAFQRRFQDGIDARSSAIGQVQTVIAYGGWSGTRGKKTTTYAGVTAGKAYLVSQQYRDMDFQSYMSQGLEDIRGDGDISRFIIEQRIWDCYIGVYANPTRAVEEITWPTS